jgi:hypothetical protein
MHHFYIGCTIFLLTISSGYAQNNPVQDYTPYYKLVNLAQMADLNNHFAEADSFYEEAFQSYNGFSEDYAAALRTRYKIQSIIDTTYFKGLVQNGELWRNVKYELERMHVENFKPFKKLYRKHKLRKTVNGSPINRLLWRDQLSRSRNLQFLTRQNSDSINAIRLSKLLVKKPELFDRTKTGFITTSILSVLLTHQGRWENASTIFYAIREKVKEGKISPDVLTAMIHRASAFEGTLFFWNKEADSLEVELEGNKQICKESQIHYSIIHGKELRSFEKNCIKLMPLNPEYTVHQINDLREYLFLLDIESAFPKMYFEELTEAEFCTKWTMK